MNPGRTKLNDRQEAAIAALLSENTHAKAAAKAGVSEATLHRWLRDEADFVEAYRAARRRVVEAAIGRLQRAAGKAVRALERNLKCGKPGDEIRAAAVILTNAVRAVELMDLADRVDELQHLLKELTNGTTTEQPGGQATGGGPRGGEAEGDRGERDPMPGFDLGAGV